MKVTTYDLYQIVVKYDLYAIISTKFYYDNKQ